jgi:hypothetical protein
MGTPAPCTTALFDPRFCSALYLHVADLKALHLLHLVQIMTVSHELCCQLTSSHIRYNLFSLPNIIE